MTSSDDDSDDAYDDDMAVDSHSSSDASASDAYLEYADKEPCEVCIKIIFKLQSGESTANITAAHLSIRRHMTDLDSSLVVFDNEKRRIQPLNITQEKVKQRFTYHPISRRHFKVIGVTHRITTKVKMSDFKSELRNVLSAHRATLSINLWSTLDVRDIGWLCNVHTYFHQRDHLWEMIQQSIQTLSNTSDVPDFKLYVRSVVDGKPSQDNRVSTTAVHIECKSKDVTSLRELFQTIYSKDKSLPGIFVPNNLQHIDNKSLHRKYILQQNKFSDDHCNISVFGVTHDDLQQSILHNKKKSSLLSILRNSSSIHWISPTPQTVSQGKWHISTTVHHYPIAVKTIQNIILNNIKEASSNMIHSTDTASLSRSTTSLTTKSYLEVLTTTSSHFDVDQPIPLVVNQPATASPSDTTAVRTANSNISSLATSTNVQNVAMSNMKEHLTRSISQFRKEFESFKQTVRDEITAHLDQNRINTEDQISTLTEKFDAVSKSLKADQASFRESLTKDLSQVIKDEVRSSMKQLSQLSPRHRHPKQNREVDHDPDISLDNKTLFSDVYESPIPSEPPDKTSDVLTQDPNLMEEDESHQHP